MRGSDAAPLDPLARIPYLPITDRPDLDLPGGARVAFWLASNVELREYLPPRDATRDPWPRTAHPDVRQYSHHDFGNRVGFWRFAAAVDAAGVPCTISCNLAVLAHYPEIARAIREREHWEVMSHGLYNTRYLTDLGEDDERMLLAQCNELAVRHTGRPLRGMLGPSISASLHTPDLLAEAGLLYHADWVHDDQPTPILVRRGRLVSVPYSYELNDAPLLRDHFEVDELVDRVRGQLAQFLAEEGGRVLCLSVHPFLVGQPQRIDAFAELLHEIAGTPGVWCATAGAIAEHYLGSRAYPETCRMLGIDTVEGDG